jgi:hypothetical protein
MEIGHCIEETRLFRLFDKTLNHEMEKAGFNSISETWVDVTVHRFGKKYKKKMVNLYGSVNEHKVDLIGMPMGTALILCYGCIEGSGEVDAKIKIYSTEKEEDVVKQFKVKFVNKLIDRLSCNISDLPLEIKLHLIRFLPVEDVLSMSEVNHEWNSICCQQDLIWKNLLIKDFPREAEFLLRTRKIYSWRTRYQDIYVFRKRSWEERGIIAPDPILALPDVPRLIAIEPPPLVE